MSLNVSPKLDEIFRIIENLNVDERASVTHKLLGTPSLGVVIGNNNISSFKTSFFFQLNSLDKDSLNQIFDQLNKQDISKLLAAISHRIAKEP